MDIQDKKVEILKAASSCFARYGYEKATLDDIGKLVRLNKASLYYYYKSKEDIYTEVIYSEADEFLNKIFKETGKVSDYKDKILTYLKERLKYIRMAINLNQLNMDSIQKLTPLFTEMYTRILEKEVTYLSDILEHSVKGEEIDTCDTRRVAKSIITVAEGIKNRLCDCTSQSEASDAMYLEVIDEVLFTISLLLDGLKKK